MADKWRVADTIWNLQHALDSDKVSQVQMELLKLLEIAADLVAGERSMDEFDSAAMIFMHSLSLMRKSCPGCLGGQVTYAIPCKECNGNKWVWRDGITTGL